MRVILHRQEALSAARDADLIAPAHATVEILRAVLLEAEEKKLKLTAGNMEIALERQIKAEVEAPGSLAFNARMFAAMLEQLDGDTVTLSTLDNGQLRLTSGTAEYIVPVYAADKYPRTEIPFPEDTVVVTGIPTMTRRTAFAVSDNDERPLMKCVNLVFTSDGLKAVGSDGYRVATAKGDTKSAASVSMLIPATSLEKLAGLVSNKDELRVGTTGKSIVFMKEDFLFSARLMEGRYFDADQMLSAATPSFTLLTDASAFREAMSAVTAVADNNSHLKLCFDGGMIRMWCGGETANSTGQLEVVPLSGQPQGEYWYNHKQLYECLKAQNGTLMVDVAQNGILLLRTDDLVCMQMSMAAPRQAQTPKAKAA